jgi:transcription antitermination factor NusG
MQILEPSTQIEIRRWYVAYTLPRHEKAIANRLCLEAIGSYVPLYVEVRCWKHRRLHVERPLFPSYVFVRMARAERVRVLSLPGVVRLLTLDGEIAAIPDDEMERIQSCVDKWKAQPFPFFISGKRVRIKSGPFAGLEGTILRRNGKRKLIVTLDLIQSAMLLDLEVAQTQLVS